ncbi:YybH family protein [Streptomyces marokkonensis]|uniref:YybH family protein n=1 Tax=Streptomyces marokkonensis TaxID=324855 RepID=A0ABW6Q6A1_9ACTN
MRELADLPEDLPAVFAERFNSGDGAALAQVYEEAAVLVPQPGTPATGPDLHAANGRLQELGVPITVRPRHVYRNGDLALLIVDWGIHGTDREGRAVHVEGTATDVARRGTDGRWRYVIDNPFGVLSAPGRHPRAVGLRAGGPSACVEPGGAREQGAGPSSSPARPGSV